MPHFRHLAGLGWLDADTLGFFVGIALAIAAAGGCDDRDSDKQSADKDTQKTTAATSPARYGAGWHAVTDSRQSNWGFAVAAGRPHAGQPVERPSIHCRTCSRPDALASIRTALMANMLPARSSVRIEQLVNRALLSIRQSAAETAPGKPMVVLATTPWNEESLLLWIEVPGLTAPDAASIGVEFDPSAVAAFRTLGDPAALPSPGRRGRRRRVAMLYELLPQRTDPRPRAAQPS